MKSKTQMYLVPNLSGKREQNEPVVPSAERETNVGRNVPNLRFPEFSGEWEYKSVKDIAPLQRGFDLPSQSLREGNYPVVYSNGIMNYHNEFRCTAPGLVTGRSGTIGKLTYIENGKYWPHNTALWVTDFKGNFPKFIFYLYEHLGLSRFSSGSGVPTLNRNDVHAYKAFIPSLPEQKKIASLLTLIDARIAIQNRVIERYESLIKAIRHRVFSEILSEYECDQTIAEALQYEQPSKYIVSSTEYSSDSSLTPVLTANKAFILGYTDETSGIYEKGKCIILDDFTLDCKIVDFPFKVKSSAVKILTPRAGVSLRYIYEYLNFLELETTEHKRHYIAEIEPMTIAIPEPIIVKKIAHTFDLLSNRLSLSKQLLQMYWSQKSFLQGQLFI